jgi:ABC-type uncharacterized transport system permease subunit
MLTVTGFVVGLIVYNLSSLILTFAALAIRKDTVFFGVAIGFLSTFSATFVFMTTAKHWPPSPWVSVLFFLFLCGSALGPARKIHAYSGGLAEVPNWLTGHFWGTICLSGMTMYKMYL